MLEVKIFEDGKKINQVEGEVTFVATMTVQGDSAHIKGLIKGKINKVLFFDALAASCAQQMVNLSNSSDEACEAISHFIDGLIDSGAQYLAKKYGNKEETEDGSIED